MYINCQFKNNWNLIWNSKIKQLEQTLKFDIFDMDPPKKHWIEDLLDEIKTFLTSDEKNFIKETFSIAKTEAKSRIEYFPESDDEIQGKISILKENIMLIVDRLEQCSESKNDFIQKFPRLLDLRKKNVQSLKSLGNDMHQHRQNCNISRLVGNSTSLLGGIVSIASAISIPFTLGLTTPVAILGGTMAGLGTATSVGSSIAEISIMTNKVEAAKQVLDDDKKSLEDLQKWLKHANDLSEAIESISLLDIGDDVIKIVCKFAEAGSKIKNIVEGTERAKNFVKLALDILKPNLLTNVLMVGKLVSLLGVFSLLYNKNNYIIDHAVQTAATITGFVPLLGATGNVIEIISTCIKTDLKISSNAIKVFSRSAVAVVGISLDIASIVLTSIDVHNGSLSEKGVEIIKIAEQLEEETDTLKEVYDKVM